MKTTTAQAIVLAFPRDVWSDPPPEIDTDDPDSLETGIAWTRRQLSEIRSEVAWLKRDCSTDEDVKEDLIVCQRDIDQIDELQRALESLLHDKRTRDHQAFAAWNAGLPIRGAL